MEDLSIRIFLNLYYFLGKPILMGYCGGENAKRIEKLTEFELVKKVMPILKKQFGDSIPNPENIISTRWAQDKFSYGAYSYLSVGSSVEDYDEIAKPIDNRLFFAGEATHSKFLATTHGAYLSGIREANRVEKFLSSSC